MAALLGLLQVKLCKLYIAKCFFHIWSGIKDLHSPIIIRVRWVIESAASRGLAGVAQQRSRSDLDCLKNLLCLFFENCVIMRIWYQPGMFCIFRYFRLSLENSWFRNSFCNNPLESDGWKFLLNVQHIGMLLKKLLHMLCSIELVYFMSSMELLFIS